ncbi:FAD-binding protein [Brachybacterium sp. MASK1Z-5]|uniref:FAD-binding protein n=1 Tax=Brachybacterium halotolerans TaxID=2795215 RepID=A0ABS1BBN6_9MICO|nr:FAD-binding protein [Brachybacterium halotolerans]MBK0331572.1 FAD-binding protein [Brachybacterium halotolerans]
MSAQDHARTRPEDIAAGEIGGTWSHCHTFGAHELLLPSTVEQLQEVVAASRQVRALGTRHSFNDVADTPGTLVNLGGFPECFELDDEGGTVTVSGGSTYAMVARKLSSTRWALRNMGSLPHISVAGAASTGTHGSGITHPNLSNAVRAIEVVEADGTLRRFTREDPRFPGRVLSLGALGVVTAVTLDLVPDFEVRQDVWFGLPWSTLLEDLEEITAASYSVSVMPDWSSRDVAGKVWFKSRTEDGGPPLDPADHGARWAAVVEGKDPEGQNPNHTVQGGVPGPWWDRLPHFRPDAEPSRGNEIQTEYFVDRARGAEALDRLRAIAQGFADLVLVSELRTVAADALWLSPSHDRDSLAIHMTWRNDPAAVLKVLPLVEEALAPFDPRTHWGKWFTLDGELIRSQYPRLDDFRSLADGADPTGKFHNEFLRRTLGFGGPAVL